MKIYKKDSKGKTRVWSMEREGSRHRTVAGLLDGKLVVSEWTQCVGKQGRTDDEQAQFEVDAAYKHKLTREYHERLEDIDGGAHFFKPMLAEKYEVFEPGFAQPKLDGVRCIATKDGLFSRQGKPITSCPHIIAELAPLFEHTPSLVLDGELYNHELKDNFNEIISLVRKQKPTPEQLAETAKVVEYHVYDLPGDEAFSSRFYDKIFTEQMFCVHQVETIRVNCQEDYDEAHGLWLEEGYEGSIWRADAAYEQKRSKALRKRKEFVDDEFELVSIEEGLGNWSGMAKRAICRLPDGRTFGAGIKGTQERARELLNEDHKVVTVQFFQFTPDGVPRFPVATKFHGAERTL
ncbi:hypothetical protein KNJ79_04925 [Sphingopyxis indica]|uniref:ATP-dependent DNA ligase n=1 Tax=Sphingopyxis indica TaxID=436663 RepID=UPI0029391329|nr:hypothetical protein [Sphingopyxis indica]WOF44274.1 hypothetical protein KNJ79_04925 [Sphingopyxis indica]